MKLWSLILAFTLASTGVSAKTVLITGSNRGLGLELATQYAADGWTVIATSRSPEDDEALQELAKRHTSVHIETLDVTDHTEIDVLAGKLRGTAIDVLINNAGIIGDLETQRLGTLDFSIADSIFATNTFGPLKMAEAFLDHVAASETKKIMNVSSEVASISLTSGNIYFYRASKTALNMLMRNFAKDTDDQGIIVGLLHPGLADTDMAAPFNMEKVPVPESVNGLRSVIAWYTPETSGTFMQYTGEPMAW